jgi:hypothetical protein
MLNVQVVSSANSPLVPGKLSDLTAERILALEMLANEQAERNWLEGELKLLERQWRDAERLAAIADSLVMPESIDQQLERGKQEARREERGG